MKPLCIELFAGTFGWGAGFIEAGYDVIGFDIMDVERELGVPRTPSCQLVLQDVLTLNGAQFRDAACIVASPPCQEYSYMAMPWSRAKQIARALRGQDNFPDGYTGSRTLPELKALWYACWRIQIEACHAAGRYIPMVIENVRGAQPWVGRSAWNYGSFHLWGDVPALMPQQLHRKVPGMNFHDFEKTGKPGRSFQTAVDGLKTIGHPNQRDGFSHTRHLTNKTEHQRALLTEVCNARDGVKIEKSGHAWYREGLGRCSSSDPNRKAASAQIAKIPLHLSRHIAQCFRPERALAAR